MVLPRALEDSFAGIEAQQLIRELLDPRPDHRITAEETLSMVWFDESLSSKTSFEGNFMEESATALLGAKFASSSIRGMASNISLATTATLVDEEDPSMMDNPLDPG